MARQPRFVLPGHPQHIIQRGNNKNIIFAEDEDYLFYLETLEEACQRHDCLIHAYVLMTNHVHFLLTPLSEESISKVMQSLGRRYVHYFNKKYQRTGTLWEGRYKATLIDTENYLLTCYRYIELNPVRAFMVIHPDQYRWSSYHYNAEGSKNTLISPHDLYKNLGKNFRTRLEAYKQLFKSSIDDEQVATIREATNKAWILGNERFCAQIAQLLDRRLLPKERGCDRRSAAFKINRV
jgi:putative transposase